jgi:hypothetical protein
MKAVQFIPFPCYGYYIIARSQDEALAEMRKRFPEDFLGFTIISW